MNGLSELSKTRYMHLLPASSNIIMIFVALKSYTHAVLNCNSLGVWFVAMATGGTHTSGLVAIRTASPIMSWASDSVCCLLLKMGEQSIHFSFVIVENSIQ